MKQLWQHTVISSGHATKGGLNAHFGLHAWLILYSRQHWHLDAIDRTHSYRNLGIQSRMGYTTHRDIKGVCFHDIIKDIPFALASQV